MLTELFEITMGNKLDMNKMTFDAPEVNFVGRSSSNNGVAAKVDRIAGLEPYPSGDITVALGGSLGTSCLQFEPFYTSQNVAVLHALEPMSIQAKLFICSVIMFECRYKYSAFGRELNVHIRDDFNLELPVTPSGDPDWAFMEAYIDGLHSKPVTTGIRSVNVPLDIQNWKEFLVDDVLKIINGKGITIDEIAEHPGDLEAVQSGEENMGVLGLISREYCDEMDYKRVDEPCLTVARSGTSGYVAYHPNGCVVGDSAKILLLKDSSAKNVYVYLFVRTILEANRYKYCYGRKVTEDGYKNVMIKLPVKSDGSPDWVWMEQYMKSLPYSDRINL